VGQFSTLQAYKREEEKLQGKRMYRVSRRLWERYEPLLSPKKPIRTRETGFAKNNDAKMTGVRLGEVERPSRLWSTVMKGRPTRRREK
jgi:hypothetical protein